MVGILGGFFLYEKCISTGENFPFILIDSLLPLFGIILMTNHQYRDIWIQGLIGVLQIQTLFAENQFETVNMTYDAT